MNVSTSEASPDKYAQNNKEGSVAAPERRGKKERMRSRKASDQRGPFRPL